MTRLLDIRVLLLGAAVTGALALHMPEAGPLDLSTLRTSGTDVSPVIFPPQRIPLRFSHIQHLTLPDGAPSCDFCHERVAESLSSLDNLMPRESACRNCHDIDRAQPDKQVPAGDPPAACTACHPGYDASVGYVARIRLPVPNIKFSHKRHLSQNISCAVCHGDFRAQRVELATRDHLPRMRTCLTCHDGAQASSECTTCHLAAAGGVMQTSFKSGKLAPSGVLYGDTHDLGFRTRHRFAAQNNADYCAKCHQKSFCVNCHNGSVKPLDFHGGDYVARHAIDARRNVPDCASCHRSQTFCTGCHTRSGVSADGRGSEFDSLDPTRTYHPPGWAEFGMRGPNHHAFQAQRNIRQCTACHREQFCLRCHSADPSGLSVNPHPPGWASSRRCRALLARNQRMCLRCHVRPEDAVCEPRLSAPLR